MSLLGSLKSSVQVAGKGGRCSVSGVVATVFGATGFMGRYVVNRLGKVGSQVVVPFRGDEHDYRHLRVAGDLGQIHFLPFQLLDKDTVRRAVEHSNVVINLIGQDTDSRHFSLEDVHVTGALNIAEAAKEAGVERLIHMSALGADKTSNSRFLQSKALGEEAVASVFPSATIIRPSHIFGYEDRFLNRFAGLRVLPCGQPLFDGGKAKKSPVYSLDVADGIAAAVGDPIAEGSVFEFVGPREYTMKEIVTFINQITRKPNKTIHVPSMLALPLTRFSDKLPVDPIISTEDILRYTKDDEVTADTLRLEHMDVKGTDMEAVALGFLRRFRSPSQHDELLDYQQ
ncbi:hypothetical protein PTSG_07208 [Salpingoeca rosetta]|uniref:NAD-dependent epimerase/dehydratase domain-containing protein n=1 Tax=Salpingoeca rosetta (strain ATCC 50818 / BSB-021) TaxID=946362 RepID=F2UED3_SALR5|nr:uncharacterized protein PTSG_07208 [Salpingoeca rosetta]EGD74983.1 hypothetical protein PTSG_07208 [Salpingoeca rosetta]|eukprot:XP_004992628.1 hypothetical protein PTSG_07208 [Salpingoeca rosetta]